MVLRTGLVAVPRIDITLDDLAAGAVIPDVGLAPLEVLRRCFHDPESLVLEDDGETDRGCREDEAVALSLSDRWGHGDMAVASFISSSMSSDVGAAAGP
ncbi:MAG: hypothetical protein U5Q44_08325 [Dehalococcoidia bacterium]|nr:hypothetical protein [Dehalococcoidia bacterium]